MKCREATLAGRRRGGSFKLPLESIRGLNEPPRPRLSKERGYFLMARPPLLCQGGEFRSLEAIKWVGHLTAWLRLSTLQTGIHSFDLDVFIVLQVPVMLCAYLFFYFQTRST